MTFIKFSRILSQITYEVLADDNAVVMRVGAEIHKMNGSFYALCIKRAIMRYANELCMRYANFNKRSASN